MLVTYCISCVLYLLLFLPFKSSCFLSFISLISSCLCFCPPVRTVFDVLSPPSFLFRRLAITILVYAKPSFSHHRLLQFYSLIFHYEMNSVIWIPTTRSTMSSITSEQNAGTFCISQITWLFCPLFYISDLIWHLSPFLLIFQPTASPFFEFDVASPVNEASLNF